MAGGKTIEPKETKLLKTKREAKGGSQWAVCVKGPYCASANVSEGNHDGRLELDGRVWQLPPGRYTLRGTISGPSKVAGGPKGMAAWEGKVEIPAQAFEIFGEPTADEFKAAIAKAQAAHLPVMRKAKWRAARRS